MRYKNNVGPQVRRRRYALGWSQSVLAAKLQIAGFDISRSGVSKIEARLSYVDDKTLLYLAEVLKVAVQDLFPLRPPGNRIHDLSRNLRRRDFEAAEAYSIGQAFSTLQLAETVKCYNGDCATPSDLRKALLSKEKRWFAILGSNQ
jgi:transcriptional regulator with XRE-family HTH domain